MVIILLSAELIRNLISLPALEDERQWASVGGVSVEHGTHWLVFYNIHKISTETGKVSLGRDQKQEYYIEPAPSKVRTTTDRRHKCRCHGRKHL